MNKAYAVMGANYGDEGKGAAVASLSGVFRVNTVARFNGGPQAGHTVCSGGARHIFSSYGSGTFTKAQTYLSEDVLFNPKAANKERQALAQLLPMSNPPVLKVNSKAFIISPWDVALNQFLEKGRGDAKHGSCGMGVGEAQFRKETELAPKFYAQDLLNPHALFTFCNDARAWFKKRVQEEATKGSFTYLSTDEQKSLFDLISTPAVLTVEMYTYAACMANVKTVPQMVLGKDDTVMFEGAQGLLLDQDDPDHQPHVTWSKTGLRNVVRECKKYNLNLKCIYYVTRPYITRHGNGPMLAGVEIKDGQKRWGKDYTNKENEFQGELRYGHLNWGMLRERIDRDLTELKDSGLSPNVKLIVTCMDQVEQHENYLFIDKAGILEIPVQDLRPLIEEKFKDIASVLRLNGITGQYILNDRR